MHTSARSWNGALRVASAISLLLLVSVVCAKSIWRPRQDLDQSVFDYFQATETVNADMYNSVFMSPDGGNVYVLDFIGERVFNFRRDDVTGYLEPIQVLQGVVLDRFKQWNVSRSLTEYVLGPDLAFSEDGSQVYIAEFGPSFPTIFHYARNLSTGLLTFAQSIPPPNTPDVTVSRSSAIAISPDGKFLWISGGRSLQPPLLEPTCSNVYYRYNRVPGTGAISNPTPFIRDDPVSRLIPAMLATGDVVLYRSGMHYDPDFCDFQQQVNPTDPPTARFQANLQQQQVGGVTPAPVQITLAAPLCNGFGFCHFDHVVLSEDGNFLYGTNGGFDDPFSNKLIVLSTGSGLGVLSVLQEERVTSRLNRFEEYASARGPLQTDDALNAPVTSDICVTQKFVIVAVRAEYDDAAVSTPLIRFYELVIYNRDQTSGRVSFRTSIGHTERVTSLACSDGWIYAVTPRGLKVFEIIDDTPQRVLYEGNHRASLQVGVPLTAVTPRYVGGRPRKYTVTPALPDGLSLHPLTGVITGTPTTASPQTEYVIQAWNAGGYVMTVLKWDVKAVAPGGCVYSSSTYSFEVGAQVDITAPNHVSGGVITSVDISPPLPAGMVLQDDGSISGYAGVITPSRTYTLLCNNTGGSAITSFTLGVTIRPPIYLQYSQPVALYTVSQDGPVNFPNVRGGKIAFWSISPALPSGLNLLSDGTIEAKPQTVLAPTTFTVTAANAAGQITTTIQITIANAAPTHLTLSPSSLTALVKEDISIRASPFAGQSPTTILTYSIVPNLPSGLTLGVDGSISGAAAAPSSKRVYTLTGSNRGGSASVELVLEIKDTFTNEEFAYQAAVAKYIIGQPITSNGLKFTPNSAMHFSVYPPLPPGLHMDTSTAEITGQPQQLQDYTPYKVTMTYFGGTQDIEVIISVVAQQPTSISYDARSSVYIVNEPIAGNNLTLSPSGIFVTYSIDPPLPVGLFFNSSDGTISGTPSELSVNLAYRVTASNTGGSTSTIVDIEITEIPPFGLTYNKTSALYVIGTGPIAHNFPQFARGQCTSYFIFPEVPFGLSFNASTGVISGAPDKITERTEHRIDCFNTGGSEVTRISIEVADFNEKPPVLEQPLTYFNNRATYFRGHRINPNFPIYGKRPPYTIWPPLEQYIFGLVFENTTGYISGTPVNESAFRQTFVITNNKLEAYNISITVLENPPLRLRYQRNPVTYRFNETFVNQAWVEGGPVAKYTQVTPLPVGIFLNSSDGSLYGRPRQSYVPLRSYLISAENSGGKVTAQLSLAVLPDPPLACYYTRNNFTFTHLRSIEPYNLTIIGGREFLSVSVQPPLPTGLSIDNEGRLTGRPTVFSNIEYYEIRVSNPTATVSFWFSIIVQKDLSLTDPRQLRADNEPPMVLARTVAFLNISLLFMFVITLVLLGFVWKKRKHHRLHPKHHVVEQAVAEDSDDDVDLVELAVAPTRVLDEITEEEKSRRVNVINENIPEDATPWDRAAAAAHIALYNTNFNKEIDNRAVFLESDSDDEDADDEEKEEKEKEEEDEYLPDWALSESEHESDDEVDDALDENGEEKKAPVIVDDESELSSSSEESEEEIPDTDPRSVPKDIQGLFKKLELDRAYADILDAEDIRLDDLQYLMDEDLALAIPDKVARAKVQNYIRRVVDSFGEEILIGEESSGSDSDLELWRKERRQKKTVAHVWSKQAVELQRRVLKKRQIHFGTTRHRHLPRGYKGGTTLPSSTYMRTDGTMETNTTRMPSHARRQSRSSSNDSDSDDSKDGEGT